MHGGGLPEAHPYGMICGYIWAAAIRSKAAPVVRAGWVAEPGDLADEDAGVVGETCALGLGLRQIT
jgi:hypothetical protein